MSTVETPVGSSVESPPEVGFTELRITADRYLRMIEAGVFQRGDRVFLWHGKLVEKMTKGRPHSFAALKLRDLLARMIPVDWHVELEQPMALGDDMMPEPDLMVIRGTLEAYQSRIPTPHDVPLIIEVADSSVAEDRGTVLRGYAHAMILTYWLVNIPRRRIEVYTQPSGPAEIPGYAVRVDHEADTEVPVVIDGRELGRIGVTILIPGRAT